MEVRQMLVQSKNYKVKCPNAMEPEFITIHNTANDASANNEIQYMCNNTQQISYHFAVDDKEIVQGIPLDRNAWHAGDRNGPGNRKSIGIEICYSRSGGERYHQAEERALSFVAQLLHERGWGIDRVKKHEDWSGKHCPHRILDEGRWGNALAQIQNELDRLSCVTQPQPEPETQPTSAYGSTGKTVVLPANATKWHFYALGVAPVLKNADERTLKPSRFGGLSYTIIRDRGEVGEHWVFEIQTSNFGRVKIYAHPSTGAVVR